MGQFFNQSDFDNYMFYKFPKAIMGKESEYKDMSDSAKILYMLFYDRLTYSLKKKRFDKNGDLYVFFTLNQISDETGWSREKARRALATLEERGLIVQKRDKVGLAFRIYVKKLVYDEPEEEDAGVDSKRDEGGIKTSPGVDSKRDLTKNYKSRTNKLRYNARAREDPSPKKFKENFKQRDYSASFYEALLDAMCGDTG